MKSTREGSQEAASMNQLDQMKPLVSCAAERDGVIIDLKDHPAWCNAPRRRQRHAAGPWAPKNIVGLKWWRNSRAKAYTGP